MVVWRYLDGKGEEVGRSDVFSDREAAEEWLRDMWEDLRQREVVEVALVEEESGEEVYRMGLEEG
jgi:hypothetical protein